MNKGITNIEYNYLNLPQVITFTNDSIGRSRRLEFIYDASGAKLRKTRFLNNIAEETIHYVNGVEYKNNVLERVAHTEGGVTRQVYGATGAVSYNHEYVLRDHLGNIRVTFTDGVSKGDPYWDWNTWSYVDPNANNAGYNDSIITSADIKQINSYYPFGLNMEGNWNGSFADAKNKYQFNGIELNTDFGLDLNTAFFRGYDGAIGRWWQIDPKPNQSESSYSGMGNNPIKFADPLGDTTWVYSSKTGKYIDRVDGKENNQIHFMSAIDYYKIYNKTEKAVRKTSKYYIGAPTRAAMNALNAPTKKYGQEQMFLMGYSKNSKELEIFNVTKNKDINITPIGALPGMSGGMDDAGIQRFIGKNSLYTFIGWGHSHPGKDSFSPTSPEFNGNGSLKNPVDFVSQGIVNPYSGFSGGNPALIVTPYGFTVYGTFIDGKDTNYSLQNLYDKQPIYLVRDCFDFNGNTVFKQ